MKFLKNLGGPLLSAASPLERIIAQRVRGPIKLQEFLLCFEISLLSFVFPLFVCVFVCVFFNILILYIYIYIYMICQECIDLL